MVFFLNSKKRNQKTEPMLTFKCKICLKTQHRRTPYTYSPVNRLSISQSASTGLQQTVLLPQTQTQANHAFPLLLKTVGFTSFPKHMLFSRDLAPKVWPCTAVSGPASSSFILAGRRMAKVDIAVDSRSLYFCR